PYTTLFRSEDRPGLLAVAGKVVALPDSLRALATGERRAVEGDVADEVEGVVVPANFLGQRVEEHALLLQLAQDRLLALGRGPALEEIVQRGVTGGHAPASVVAQRLRDQLPIRPVVLDPLRHDEDRDVVDHVFHPSRTRPVAFAEVWALFRAGDDCARVVVPLLAHAVDQYLFAPLLVLDDDRPVGAAHAGLPLVAPGPLVRDPP